MVANLQGWNRTGGEELVEYLQREFDLALNRDSVLKLLRCRNLDKILDGIMTIEESILHSKIVEDPEPFKGKKWKS